MDAIGLDLSHRAISLAWAGHAKQSRKHGLLRLHPQQQRQHQHNQLRLPLRATYTEKDACLQAGVCRPNLIDVSSVLAGQAPSREQIQAVREGCINTGFLAITGHGIPAEQLASLFSAGRRFFDLPLQQKLDHTVGNMRQGRGYEISPEHKAYMQQWQPAAAAAAAAAAEPSALEGILSERFCCGPPFTSRQLEDPYYSCGLGQVFFAPDCWPTAASPELQQAMQATFLSMAQVADAVLELFAAALALPPGFFRDKTDRPCSNMQVANYPSQLPPLPGPGDLRKKAHVDSGTLTLLASDDWLEGSSWQPGDGGLQLLDSREQWLEVAVPPGALLLNLGSIMTRWTNGSWKSTLHRVTNPAAPKAGSSRRVSVAFFQKPNFDALIEVLPTCCSSATTSSAGGAGEHSKEAVAAAAAAAWLGSEAGPAKYPPVVAAELTRAGILHKYRHLPPEEASRVYHEELAATRSGATDNGAGNISGDV